MTSTTKRKSTGKRLRFEVFKRDFFTCQYCGAQPPDVVLVVDHIVPVAGGGESSAENLITACDTCNQGKADKLLGDRAVRPDADLMYLEVQQEAAELARFQEAFVRKQALIAEVVGTLQNHWIEVSGLDWAPSDGAINSIVSKYGPDVAADAITDVAAKVGGGYISERGDHWLKYLYSVARNMHDGQRGEGQES